MLSRHARSCSRRFRQPQVPASTQACGALLQHGRSISSGSFVGSPTANRESSWHRLGIEMKKELSHRAGYATAAQGTPSSDLQSTDLLDVYQSLVARGVLVWDEEQVRCVMEVSTKESHPIRQSFQAEESNMGFSSGSCTTSSRTTPLPSSSSVDSPPTPQFSLANSVKTSPSPLGGTRACSQRNQKEVRRRGRWKPDVGTSGKRLS